MGTDYAAGIAWVVVLLALAAVAIVLLREDRGERGPGVGVGPGAAGAMYDLLNQDRRNAIELIVEEKAGARDAEDADGNLPDLQDPKRRD